MDAVHFDLRKIAYFILLTKLVDTNFQKISTPTCIIKERLKNN